MMEGGIGGLPACLWRYRGPQRPSPIWSLHTRVSHLFTPPTDMFAGAALRHSKKLCGSGVGSSGLVSGSDPQMSTSCNFLSLTEEERTHQRTRQNETTPTQKRNHISQVCNRQNTAVVVWFALATDLAPSAARSCFSAPKGVGWISV